MSYAFKYLLKTPTWFTIILGSLLLFYQTLQGILSQNIQVAFFITLIALTGIPHGALDHLIQKQTDKQLNRSYNFTGFLVKYLLIMALYAVAWYWFSGISLLIFLVISAWHFGETDLDKAPKHISIWSFTRLFYGFYLLAFILLTHSNEVNPIISKMLGNRQNALDVWVFTQKNVKQILYLLGLILSTIFIVAQSEHYIVFDKVRAVRLGLILGLSVFLPLLPAFALYFGGWHALCAFDSIHNYLRKDYPTLSFKSVYLKSLPFTTLAIIFLGCYFWYIQHYNLQYDPFPILFIFISLITLPHLIIAHQMNHEAE